MHAIVTQQTASHVTRRIIRKMQVFNVIKIGFVFFAVFVLGRKKTWMSMDNSSQCC